MRWLLLAFRFLFIVFLLYTQSGCSGCYFFVKIEDLDKKDLSQNSNNNNNTDPSNETNPSPVVLNAISSTSTTITLSWTPSPTALFYSVAYGTQSGVYIQTFETGILQPPFTVTGLSFDTQYFLVVRAHYANDLVVSSNEITTTTVFSCNDFTTTSNLTLKGAGTQLDPYILCSPNQLVTLSKPTSTSYLNKHYKLEGDIDMSLLSENYTPIGTSTDPFTGSLNGNSHTIKNWNWTLNNTSNQGLFGYINYSQIYNLNFNNINFQITTTDNVGVLAGKVVSNSMIENLNFENVTITGSGNYIGTTAGFASGGLHNITVKNTVELSIDGDQVGGVVGCISSTEDDTGVDTSGQSVYIANSKSSATIVANSEVGGIVGKLNNNTFYGGFANIYNNFYNGVISNKTTAAMLNVGGITGYSANGFYYKNHFKGQIHGDSAWTVGGIAGSLTNDYVLNSISEGTISFSISGTNIGGIAGRSLGYILFSHSSTYLSGSYDIGGIAGYLFSGDILQSVFSGEVHGKYNGSSFGVGGLVGYMWGGASLKYNYSRGKVYNTSGSLGGVVGFYFNPSANNVVTATYWNKEANNVPNFCGNYTGTNCNQASFLNLGKTTAQLKNPSTFNVSEPINWSFFNVTDSPYDFWVIDPVSGYPDLFWKVFDPAIHNPFPGGSGTKEDPFWLSQPSDFNLVSNNSTFLEKHFKLTNDIDFSLSSATFSMWGDFRGSLDGQGFALKNLNLLYSSLDYVGLTTGSFIYGLSNVPFSTLDNQHFLVGEFKNLKINNFTVWGKNKVGALSGSPYSVNIENVQMSGGDVSSPIGSDVGGLAYNCYSIKNTTSSTQVMTGGDSIGGLCNTARHFENVEFTSSVQGRSRVGGLFSMLIKSPLELYNPNLEISTNGTFDGPVVSGITTGTFLGGAIAIMVNSKVHGLKVNSSINSFSKIVGGVVGYMASSVLSNAIYDAGSSNSIVSNGTNIGGLVGRIDKASFVYPYFTTWSDSNKIENSYVLNGSILTSGSIIGGLIGEIGAGATSVSISNSYSAITVGTISGSMRGGFIGINNLGASLQLSSNFWDKTLNFSLNDLSSGAWGNTTGVRGATTSEMKSQDIYINGGWDGTNIWNLPSPTNINYPTLK